MSYAHRPSRLAPIASAVLCLMLAACGGGGSGSIPAASNSSTSGGTNTGGTTYGPVSQPTVTSRFNAPAGVALDSAGANLYVADQGNCVIRKVTLTPSVAVSEVPGTNTLCSGGNSSNSPHAIAFDPSDATGDTFWIAGGSTVSKASITNASPVATILGQNNLHNATGIAIDSLGDIYVANDKGDGTGTIVVGTPLGKIVTLTGFTGPQGIARDSSGNLFVTDRAADGTTQIKKVTFTASDLAAAADASNVAANITPITIAGQTFANGAGIAVASNGDIVFVEKKAIVKISGTTATTIRVNPSVLNTLVGLAIDGAGNYLITDAGNHTVSRVAPANGAFTTLAGMAGQSGLAD